MGSARRRCHRFGTWSHQQRLCGAGQHADGAGASGRSGGARDDAGAGAQDHGAPGLAVETARLVPGHAASLGAGYGHDAGDEGHDSAPGEIRCASVRLRPRRLSSHGAAKGSVLALAETSIASGHRMPRKKTETAPPLELRDACIVAAQEVIAERGIENLSLRDVARKLGVSHQAPYKHYPSRDHLLAEVMRRCFQRFAAHLDARQRFRRPGGGLGVTRCAVP